MLNTGELMAGRIESLPTAVVHLMAAGEVVDSLAAVVRELIENALDAAATRITISVDTHQWRVRVADNGVGMDLVDLQKAATPHSTSKIRDRADLDCVRSLGFRGEALHSLAQLAELQIASRPAHANQGWSLIYDRTGQSGQPQPVAIAPGTVVTVNHLFDTWLSRRQNLPPLAQQLRQVHSTVQHLALCHPQVTWQVQHNDQDWFNLFPGGTARHILPQLLRDVQITDLQEITLCCGEQSASLDAASLYLLVGLPDRCHRHRPDWIKLAVNGRCVALPELEQTILSSFRRILPRDRFPIAFLHLRVPPEQIDWNRHPAKSEVYLRQLDTWRNQVTKAIDQALCLSSAVLPESLYSRRLGTLIKAAEAEQPYGHKPILSGDVNLEEVQPDASLAPQSDVSDVGELKAIAQVHQRYILAEHSTGVWLIEQHIAHERVLYEQLCDHWQLIALETPVLLHHLRPAQVEQLQRLGLEIDCFGEQVWAVRTLPALLVQRDDRADALLELSLGGDLTTAQVAVACRSAIRNGTPLSLEEMQALLDQWQRTRNPRTCPHGRPICLTLAESTLARFFRRHWVIGKSHGI